MNLAAPDSARVSVKLKIREYQSQHLAALGSVPCHFNAYRKAKRPEVEMPFESSSNRINGHQKDPNGINDYVLGDSNRPEAHRRFFTTGALFFSSNADFDFIGFNGYGPAVRGEAQRQCEGELVAREGAKSCVYHGGCVNHFAWDITWTRNI